MKIVNPSVELLWITPNAEAQIEVAGRTCYKSEARIHKGTSAAFCKKMRKSGHHAMIEFAVATFRIITDRGITHETVRHRLASYAQESTRYCNYSQDKFGSELTFIQPPGMTKKAKSVWERGCLHAEEAYMEMLKEGCSAQIARSVLPNCLKTEIVSMMNFRQWRHFITLRASAAAHPQIQPIAKIIRDILVKEAPSVFEDLMTI